MEQTKHRFKFKQENDPIIYTYQGTEEELRSINGKIKIISKTPPLEWDKNLKKYV